MGKVKMVKIVFRLFDEEKVGVTEIEVTGNSVELALKAIEELKKQLKEGNATKQEEG